MDDRGFETDGREQSRVQRDSRGTAEEKQEDVWGVVSVVSSRGASDTSSCLGITKKFRL